MQPANGSLAGNVVRVDDESFEIADDGGNRHMFHVAIDMSIDGPTLTQLQREGMRVVVEYDDETPAGHMAHRVFPAPRP
jgi:hypothetical protein